MRSFIFYSFWILISCACIWSKEDAKCDEQLNAFATTTSNFTACAIANSKPITLCEGCVENYIQLLESYRNMSEENEGVRCIDNYVDLDRLQIVKTMYYNSYTLWNRAKCNDCFEFVNTSLSPKISNKTRYFDQYYENFAKCFNGTHRNDSKVICDKCLDNYMVLDDYYVSISNENDKIGVCMDIVDIMNTTRSFWSANCCKYRQHEEYIFVGCTIGIFLITAIFYLLTHYLEEKEKPLILQQNRLAESLSHLNKEIDLISEEDE